MATPEPYPYRQLNYPVNNLEQNFDQTKKIQVRENIGIPTSIDQTDKVLGVTAATGELDWLADYRRVHDLICQLKPILISGSTSMRFILCDRQKYTLNNDAYIFEPVDLYQLAVWINRGDVIQIDGAVASDPWGDRYPMQITEMQCSIDSSTNKRYCTNIEVRGYAYSSTENYYWGDNITDEATGTRYLEFQTWT